MNTCNDNWAFALDAVDASDYPLKPPGWTARYPMLATILDAHRRARPDVEGDLGPPETSERSRPRYLDGMISEGLKELDIDRENKDGPLELLAETMCALSTLMNLRMQRDRALFKILTPHCASN